MLVPPTASHQTDEGEPTVGVARGVHPCVHGRVCVCTLCTVASEPSCVLCGFLSPQLDFVKISCRRRRHSHPHRYRHNHPHRRRHRHPHRRRHSRPHRVCN